MSSKHASGAFMAAEMMNFGLRTNGHQGARSYSVKLMVKVVHLYSVSFNMYFGVRYT